MSIATADFFELPSGRYRAILADPPWNYRSWTALQASNFNIRLHADNHYPKYLKCHGLPRVGIGML